MPPPFMYQRATSSHIPLTGQATRAEPAINRAGRVSHAFRQMPALARPVLHVAAILPGHDPCSSPPRRVHPFRKGQRHEYTPRRMATRQQNHQQIRPYAHGRPNGRIGKKFL